MHESVRVVWEGIRFYVIQVNAFRLTLIFQLLFLSLHVFLKFIFCYIIFFFKFSNVIVLEGRESEVDHIISFKGKFKRNF